METMIPDVFAAPREVARRWQELPYLSSVRLADTSRRVVRYNLRFEPWEEFSEEGYPSERIRLEIRSNGGVRAYPANRTDGRTWEHRFPRSEELCLYYPNDPDALVWSSRQHSLEKLLGIISRHLIGEEFRRRHGRWPWEDAPHGEEAAEGPRSALMRSLAGLEKE